MDMLSEFDNAIEDSVHNVALQDKHKPAHRTPHHAVDENSTASTLAYIKSFK